MTTEPPISGHATDVVKLTDPSDTDRTDKTPPNAPQSAVSLPRP